MPSMAKPKKAPPVSNTYWTPARIALRERYEERLADGWELIEKRKAAGAEWRSLEDFWLTLNREYEEFCDEHEGTKRRAS